MRNLSSMPSLKPLSWRLILGGFFLISLPSAEAQQRPQKSMAEDVALVRSLLAEDLSNREFSFATIVVACSNHRVIPLTSAPSHQRVLSAIQQALRATLDELNAAESPVRKLARINEASRFFENAILKHLNSIPGMLCEIPPNRHGDRQRSGYPDLRIVDQASKDVFYLDPKLLEQGSETSHFRTFYFEPKTETLKITDDAVHLLVGIEHDGKNPDWKFTRWRIVDLSTLQVRLKAEFQASNAELYSKTPIFSP
jgi:hypothetical protein